MKRVFILLAVVTICHSIIFGQKKYVMVIEKTDGTEIATNVEDIVRTYFRERTEESGDNSGGSGTVGDETTNAYHTCPDSNHPHMIDLGLPSGTKWACCNVGASAPEQYGNYYAWGETSPKSVYNWDTYQYGYYNYDGNYSHLVYIGSAIAGTRYDAATANWGAPWRMPSLTQIEELLNKCSSTRSTQNGVKGRKFVGPNGGTIFLPAAGYRWGSDLSYAGSRGYYWSSSLYEGLPGIAFACYLYFYSYSADWNNDGRSCGRSVRPVR